MRKRCHLFVREATEFPSLHPRPGANISNAILALPLTCEVLSRLAGKLAREADLEHAVDAEGLILEALDGICKNCMSDLDLTILPRDSSWKELGS